MLEYMYISFYTCMVLCLQKGETTLSVAKTEEIKELLEQCGECSIPLIPMPVFYCMCYRSKLCTCSLQARKHRQLRLDGMA